MPALFKHLPQFARYKLSAIINHFFVYRVPRLKTHLLRHRFNHFNHYCTAILSDLSRSSVKPIYQTNNDVFNGCVLCSYSHEVTPAGQDVIRLSVIIMHTCGYVLACPLEIA